MPLFDLALLDIMVGFDLRPAVNLVERRHQPLIFLIAFDDEFFLLETLRYFLGSPQGLANSALLLRDMLYVGLLEGNLDHFADVFVVAFCQFDVLQIVCA